MKYITGKIGYQPLIDAGLAPIRRSLVPYYVKTLNTVLKTEGVDLFLQDVIRLRLFQVTPEWARVDEAIVNGLAPVWNGTEALETALVKINDMVNAILKE